MTTSIRRHVLMIIAAAIFSIAGRAEAACPATPEEYQHLEFGDVRFAVEEDCRRTFTQREQFFLAGVAQTLQQRCKLLRDAEERLLMEQFTKAATLSLDLQKQPGPLRDRVPTQRDRAAAFAAGTSMMQEIRCNGPEAALLARGLVIYLKRTSTHSRFVEGCVEVYAGRYDENQCRCMSEAVRRLMPDVDARFFDRELVKASIHESPRLALTLMLSCDMSQY